MTLRAPFTLALRSFQSFGGWTASMVRHQLSQFFYRNRWVFRVYHSMAIRANQSDAIKGCF
jgi:hypothetical protein